MKLLLVDGMALLYRAFYAMIRSPLRDAQGRNTSAVFGFARVLLSLLEREKPTHWAVAYDTPVPTFRHVEYPEYKAHRPPMPEELVPQIDEVRRLLEGMRVPLLSRDGHEADDLMAALARRHGAEGVEVRLFSSDKDLLQVVDEHVHALVPQGKGEEALDVGPAQVREAWGVGPEHIVDVLALMGDSVDNVPGVRGVGEKTAVKLMSQYGSLEALYERLEEVTPPGVREKLRAGREAAFLSRRLVTLDLECASEYELDDFVVRPMDAPRLVELCREWDFRRLGLRFAGLEPRPGDDWLMDRGGAPAPAAAPPVGGGSAPSVEAPATAPRASRAVDASPAPAFARAEDARAALAALERLTAAPRVAAELVPDAGGRLEWVVLERGGDGVALRWSAASGHAGARAAAVRFFAEGPPLVLGDAKEAARLLLREGLPGPRIADDLGLAAHLAELGREAREAVLGEALDELPPPGQNLRLDLGDREAPVERIGARLRHRLAEAARMRAVLESRGLLPLYQDLELPFAPLLARMEETGVRVDPAVLRELSQRYTADLAAIQADIYRLAGIEFNILSPKQLGHVLFEKHNLPAGRKTKTGFSTDVEVLEELALTYELPGRVLEYRQLSKLLSTYVDALPAMLDPATGRIHARFHQGVVPTGRLSSSDPNLQNIPIRSAQGKEIRRAFVTDPGWMLISADYSQIELRVMAHFSGEPAFIQAFERGEDIHARTAAEVAGVPISEVSPEQRGRAKAVNFGLMYGMGAQTLARRLKISQREAAEFIERYFSRLPAVRAFRERLVQDAREKGYVTTLMGRRISLPALKSGDRRATAGAERVALNAPLQGSAADLIKRAMLDLDARLRSRGLPARITIQVHDELVLECEASCVDEVTALSREAMEGAAALRVPLTASVGTGLNWFEIH